MIKIREEFIQEALSYAEESCRYTSNRHDFHDGKLADKKQKMYEGKLGEKIFKEFLIKQNVIFLEDNSPANEADLYDFLIHNLRVDVKTRTKPFHTRTLEMVEQMQRDPKDIYVSIKLDSNKQSGSIIGWATSEDFINHNRIQNNGYLDNYVLYDNELRTLKELIDLFNHLQS